jgi:hypothetical protein
MAQYLENDAVISDCGQYRYLLRRVWDHVKPRALFVMLNPSTADAKVDDPTIRSCVRLARGLGYGSIEVVNVFGWRATNPDELPKQADPMGPMNERIVAAAVARCDVVICAWGANAMAAGKTQYLCDRILSYRPAAYCLGKTKSGAPRHPLYVKSGTALETYRPN